MELIDTLETSRVFESYGKFPCLLTFFPGLGKVQLLNAFLDRSYLRLLFQPLNTRQLCPDIGVLKPLQYGLGDFICRSSFILSLSLLGCSCSSWPGALIPVAAHDSVRSSKTLAGN